MCIHWPVFCNAAGVKASKLRPCTTPKARTRPAAASLGDMHAASLGHEHAAQSGSLCQLHSELAMLTSWSKIGATSMRCQDRGAGTPGHQRDLVSAVNAHVGTAKTCAILPYRPHRRARDISYRLKISRSKFLPGGGRISQSGSVATVDP